jgi:hypothetical protein
MTFDTPLGAALFVVALVAAVATFAVALFRSAVALEQWLETPASAISDGGAAAYVESEPRPATLDQNVDTRVT